MIGKALRVIALVASSTLALVRPTHAAPLTWSVTLQHLGWNNPSQVVRTQTYHIPIRYPKGTVTGTWTRTTQVSPHVRKIVRYPIYAKTVVQQRPVYGTTETWLVTYYTWTGNRMANGLYPAVGFAACGYDVALGTRVIVPGIGVLTCGDRMGYAPYHHVDVYGIPLGTGYRAVTVVR